MSNRAIKTRVDANIFVCDQCVFAHIFVAAIKVCVHRAREFQQNPRERFISSGVRGVCAHACPTSSKQRKHYTVDLMGAHEREAGVKARAVGVGHEAKPAAVARGPVHHHLWHK